MEVINIKSLEANMTSPPFDFIFPTDKPYVCYSIEDVFSS